MELPGQMLRQWPWRSFVVAASTLDNGNAAWVFRSDVVRWRVLYFYPGDIALCIYTRIKCGR
ncbi:hypothetical protein BCAR13_1150037 [Paraburkholderia caribensis]|nr:hypothetical protein BCAR13_1150037 [Paraburkholderia caribensis]